MAPARRAANKPSKCEARTATGRRCTRNALPGEARCRQHLSAESAGGAPRALDRVVGQRGDTQITVSARIVEAVAAGTTFKDAAASAGVSARAVEKWRTRGERWLDDEGEMDPDTPAIERPFVRFVRDFKRAEADSVVTAIAVIRNATRGTPAAPVMDPEDPTKVLRDAKGNPIIDKGTKGDWTAAAWLAERRRPADYARPQRVEHSGAIDTGSRPDTVADLSALPVEDRERLLELEREREGLLAQAGKEGTR